MKLLVNTLSVSCIELPFIVQWPHHISSVNIIKLTKMDEHLWSHCYFIVLRSGHCERGKITDVAKCRFSLRNLQISQNTDFHFLSQIAVSLFFLIQCLSQFLKLIVRPPLNYSFFFLRPRLWKWKPFSALFPA